jgi:hypothetical protein
MLVFPVNKESHCARTADGVVEEFDPRGIGIRAPGGGGVEISILV